MEPSQKDKRRTLLNTHSLIYVFFAVLCFVSAKMLENPRESKKYELEGNEFVIGPFSVPANKSVYQFEVDQRMSANNWSYVTVELLDENKNFLHAFGDELWNETGYEQGSYWHESDTHYETKITVDKKGEYYFNVSVEASDFNEINPAYLKVTRLRGSSLWFYWVALISLIIGIILNEINRRTIINLLTS